MNPATSEIANVKMKPASSEAAEVEMGSKEHLKTMAQEHIINIPTIFSPSTANQPDVDLLGTREKYFEVCVRLYEASITGDWAAAEPIFNRYPPSVRSSITENHDTSLHVSASVKETKLTVRFVQNLVTRMSPSDLELHNNKGNTALCLASVAGNTMMVKIMVEKNNNLVNIPGSQGTMLPLQLSALHEKYDTVKYLYKASDRMKGKPWNDEYRKYVLEKCVVCDFFDIARDIVWEHPKLAMSIHVFGLLAGKADALNGVLEQNLLTRIINYSISRILHMKVRPVENSDALGFLTILWINTILKLPRKEVDYILRGPPDPTLPGVPQYPCRGLFIAAETGNTRFVVELLRVYPDYIADTDDDNYSIFHVAVMNRHHDIHNLLYEIGAMKDMLTTLEDRDGNNMLHLVGKTSVKMRPKTSGASLLMQRELLWFKEIEKMIPPSYREKKNNKGQTPYELFSEANKDLVSQGLNWVKDCMVVATLIVTVAFAVAFTVPGGYDQTSGIPIFIHKRTASFLVFVIADAISLFSSSTSLLVLLSILASRQGQRHFLYSLPRKLMLGLVTLFISVAAMMVTFSASFFVLYHRDLKWVPLFIATFSAMPVVVFAYMQFPLFVDMFISVHDSRYLFCPRERILYNKKQRWLAPTKHNPSGFWSLAR